MERVDVAIIGSGPAGISAALNLNIRHKSFYLFGAEALSEKVEKSECISNYPAFDRASGKELNRLFAQQLDSAGISVISKRITGIYKMKSHFILLCDEEEFEARAVILATGVEAVSPVAGERELLGHGVSYCATCDGNLYKNKTIAVICDNEPMQEEAEYLSNIAGQVYYYPMFNGNILKRENISYLSSPVTQILGNGRVSAVRCKNGEETAVDGVFFLKQSVSPAVLLRGLNEENGVVAVDRNMATNIKGCFAAGDCTGTPYQIAKAVGEGNIAAHSVFKYLAQTEKETKYEADSRR